MQQMSATVMERDIRVPLVYGSDEIRVIADEVGLVVTDAESAAILEHVDREVARLARTAVTAALRARIVDLLSLVSSIHEAPTGRRPDRRRPWIVG
jgi:hypothetical protein